MVNLNKKEFERKYNFYKTRVVWETKMMERHEGTKAWNRAEEKRAIYLAMLRDLEDIAQMPSKDRWDHTKYTKA